MTDHQQKGVSEKPARVVILGGGPSAIAAAFWLSDPSLDGQFDITVYSQGWRLGGKCASGRNKEIAERIEEHGLHILMGCYENAFATLRACYKEWRERKSDPDNALQDWTDGFKPQRLVSLMDRGIGGKWDAWNIPFPQLPGEPGDGEFQEDMAPGNSSPTPDGQLVLDLMDMIESAIPNDAPFKGQVETWFWVVRHKIKPGGLQPWVGEKEALEKAQAAIGSYLDGGKGEDAALAIGVVDTLRMLAIGIDLAIATTLGYITDLLGKGEAGYEAINQLDLREWLKKHGAMSVALNSGMMNAMYDLAFAQVDGAMDSPGSLAAGASFRAQLEIAVGYRNAPLWRMMAGTADTVFTPFYDVLTERGVDIQLFHRVTGLKHADGQMSEIVVRRQARTLGDKRYEPLRRITFGNGKQLDSWPSEPDWSQLVDGEKLKEEGVNFEYSGCDVFSDPPRTLVAGEDFDIAISGLPPLSLEPLLGDLAATNAKWNSALGESRSVATQAMQLWMKHDLEELGWTHGTTVLTSYEAPYDSWGDMSELIAFECWSDGDNPAGTVPKSLGYFCGTMQLDGGPISPPGLEKSANEMANSWIAKSLSGLWPNFGNGAIETLPVSSYIRANYDLSEQYVQTPAGKNVGSRFDPGEPAELSNFYAIGDWTKTRFSGGCFESAVESGMLASRAISGVPAKIKTA